MDEDTEQFPVRAGEELTGTDFSLDVQPAVTSSRYEDPLRYEDPVMQISGTGHWFLKGWIGDHSVEFLVFSGSSVTAMSDTFYRNLVHADAPLGVLQDTARTLRSANGTGIEVLGTLVFAGLTRESIDVMVPDCIVPPACGTVRVDLRHHVSLSLGPALDMAHWVPEPNMEKALCPSSLADTLGLQRRQYWEELNPILKKWKSVNNSHCPESDQPIKVNMARHLRLVHTTLPAGT